MPYIKKTTKTKKSIYVEKVYAPRYGKHTIPGPKQKKTKESVKRVNDRNRIKKLARLIENNFDPGDWHITFTFRKEERTSDPDEISSIKSKLTQKLKRFYKKADQEFRWVFVVEHLKTTIHFHMILQDLPGLGKAVRAIWEKGSVYLTPLYDDGTGYQKLAEYLCKEKSTGEKGRSIQAYSCSRNLERPDTKVEVIKSLKWSQEPKPIKGYYVDKKTVYQGIDDWGYLQQFYTLRKIEDEKKNDSRHRKRKP